MISIKDWEVVLKHNGLYKNWIYDSHEKYIIACSYLEKMNYLIKDFQYACEHKEYRGNLIYIIAMMSWAFDITEHFINKPSEFPNGIHSLIDEKIIFGFKYSNEKQFKDAKKYMKALRSFVLAHPLDTTDKRHKKFDLDGEYFAVDVNYMKNSLVYLMSLDDSFRHLDYDGMHKMRVDSDIFIFAYPVDIKIAEHGLYIGFSLDDVIMGVRLCMDALKEFDIYLSKLKKKDFIRKK